MAAAFPVCRHSGMAMSASVPSPDNHHSAALETSNSHKLYRTGGPNGTTTSCPPPSVSEPYSPPKVGMNFSESFQNSQIANTQSHKMAFIDFILVLRGILYVLCLKCM